MPVCSHSCGGLGLRLAFRRVLMAPTRRNLRFSTDTSPESCKRKLNAAALGTDVGSEEYSWESLGVPPKELNLGLTLLTGQSFLWKQTRPNEFTGVVYSYLVSLKQTANDTLYYVHDALESEEAEILQSPCASSDSSTQLVQRSRTKLGAKQALQDYFTLGTSLESLWTAFSAADARFAAVAPYIQGARLLRQNPLECVFQFICSSNNHIQRITQMVGYLAGLGCHLGWVNGHEFNTFPTLEQLSLVNEKQLRKAGFGYRSKYIVGAVEALRSQDGGGEKWLKSLRYVSLEEATIALCTLPGIGPKVAACVALFSLDKHHAIPVDTHVWQIAVQHLTPELAGERLTAKMHRAVAEAFVTRFGEYAGWAHTVLFIAELSSHQKLLPEHLQSQRPSKSKRQKKTAAA